MTSRVKQRKTTATYMFIAQLNPSDALTLHAEQENQKAMVFRCHEAHIVLV